MKTLHHGWLRADCHFSLDVNWAKQTQDHLRRFMYGTKFGSVCLDILKTFPSFILAEPSLPIPWNLRLIDLAKHEKLEADRATLLHVSHGSARKTAGLCSSLLSLKDSLTNLSYLNARRWAISLPAKAQSARRSTFQSWLLIWHLPRCEPKPRNVCYMARSLERFRHTSIKRSQK